MRKYTIQVLSFFVLLFSSSLLAFGDTPSLEELHQVVGEKLGYRLNALQYDLRELTAYVAAQSLSEEQLDLLLEQFRSTYPDYVGVFCKAEGVGSAARPDGFPDEAVGMLSGLTLQDAPIGGDVGVLHLVDGLEGVWILLLNRSTHEEKPVLAGVAIRLNTLLSEVTNDMDEMISGASVGVVDRKGDLVQLSVGDAQRYLDQENRGFFMDHENMRVIRRASYSRSMHVLGTQWMVGLYYAGEPVDGEVPPLTGRWMGAYTEDVLGLVEESSEREGGKLEALSMQREKNVKLFFKGESFTANFSGFFSGGEVFLWEVTGEKTSEPSVCLAEFDSVRKALKGTLMIREGELLIKKSFYLLRAKP